MRKRPYKTLSARISPAFKFMLDEIAERENRTKLAILEGLIRDRYREPWEPWGVTEPPDKESA